MFEAIGAEASAFLNVYMTSLHTYGSDLPIKLGPEEQSELVSFRTEMQWVAKSVGFWLVSMQLHWFSLKG